MRFPPLICFLILTVAGTAFADTTWVAAGSVSGHWSAAHSPYIVQGAVQVASTDTLEIGSGVTVLFAGWYPLQVNGVLQVNGTVENPAFFTADTVSNPDGWSGIRFLRPSGASTLIGAVIENGRALEPADLGLGGGVFCDAGEIALFSTTIRDCRAGSGSGIYARNGSNLTLIGCSIRNNTYPSGSGGGICMRSGSQLVLENCVFVSNGALYGGGLCIDGTNATIMGCEIRKNHANIWGGGLFCTDADITISHCILQANTSIGGGGIETFTSTRLHMDHCLIEGNSASADGAQGPGGGLAFYSGDQWITNCTFAGNMAARGGAIYAGSDTRLENTIVAYQPSGGGIFFPVSGSDLRYCCVFGNVGGDLIGPLPPRDVGRIVRTNVNGDSCDFYYNLFLDPLFDDTASTSYRLSGGSPCIDAGDPASPHDPDGSVADMGAFYYDASGTGRRPAPVAHGLRLHPAYPNPFNPATTITFDVPAEGRVLLKIYDLMGRGVAVLADDRMGPGSYAAVWNADGQPAGMYFAVLTSGGARSVQRLLLLK